MIIPVAQASKIESLIKHATMVTQQIVVLVFIMAIVVFGWGIVKMISAAGNTDKLKQAKGIIWWGIIGMFVLASIGGIIKFLQGELTIKQDPTLIAPQFETK